jgi:hypothetical protein
MIGHIRYFSSLVTSLLHIFAYIFYNNPCLCIDKVKKPSGTRDMLSMDFIFFIESRPYLVHMLFEYVFLMVHQTS